MKLKLFITEDSDQRSLQRLWIWILLYESKETGKTMGFDETWRIRCEQVCIYEKQ